MRHFYGFDLRELKSMPMSIFNEFWLAITVIEAQQMLTWIEVESYPHIKKEERKKIVSRLKKLAYTMRENNDVMSTADLARQLAERMQGGIG